MLETLVEDKTSDDASYPEVLSGVKFNSTKCVRFFPTISSGGEATFTILMNEGGKYYPVLSITCSDDTPFDVKIDRNHDVNCYTTGVTGTVTLKARPHNFNDC